MNLVFRLCILFCISLAIAGCGKKGDLIAPSSVPKSAEVPAEAAPEKPEKDDRKFILDAIL